jgi:hypothetical protein
MNGRFATSPSTAANSSQRSSVIQTRKCEFRARSWLESLDQIAKRKSDPGNHYRAGFDTAQAVDPLLERMRLEQIFEPELSDDLGLTRHGDLPGSRRNFGEFVAGKFL